MYRNIVTGPSTSFVVCNQCDQIVTKVICLMFLCWVVFAWCCN